MTPRALSKKAREEIRSLLERRKDAALVRYLLTLKRFPLKDSYVSFLRSYEPAIVNNPQTVSRLCNNLYKMGFNKVVAAITAPPEANQRRGPQFRNWLKNNFKFAPIDKFKAVSTGVLFLDASEKETLDFANKYLNIGINKRPDFLAKAGREYVIGEAKFLTALGGNQSRGFEDALKLATKATGKAFKAFVLDGVIWVSPGSQDYKQIEYTNINVFSALLLGVFLRNLAR